MTETRADLRARAEWIVQHATTTPARMTADPADVLAILDALDATEGQLATIHDVHERSRDPEYQRALAEIRARRDAHLASLLADDEGELDPCSVCGKPSTMEAGATPGPLVAYCNDHGPEWLGGND